MILLINSQPKDEVKGYESFKTLVTVFYQQCKVSEGNETSPCEITIREKPEGEEIVSSPHNTNARYVKKGKQKVCGHKGFMSETCDETNKPQFITDAEVTPATRAGCSRASGDSEAVRGVREEAAGAVCRCRVVCEWTSDTIFTSRWYKAGMVECRSSQSFEKYEAEDRPLDIADFEVKVEGEIGELTVVACPERQMPQSLPEQFVTCYEFINALPCSQELR